MRIAYSTKLNVKINSQTKNFTTRYYFLNEYRKLFGDIELRCLYPYFPGSGIKIIYFIFIQFIPHL